MVTIRSINFGYVVNEKYFVEKLDGMWIVSAHESSKHMKFDNLQLALNYAIKIAEYQS